MQAATCDYEYMNMCCAREVGGNVMHCVYGPRQTYPGHKGLESQGREGGAEEATSKCTNTAAKRKVIKNADGTDISLEGPGQSPHGHDQNHDLDP